MLYVIESYLLIALHIIEKVTIMDTVKFYMLMTEYLINLLQNKDELDKIGIKIYGNKFFLKHPFGLKNIDIHFNFDKKQMWLETSLPKLLQGHNVFGCYHLQEMCLEVIKLIYKQFGLDFSTSECKKVVMHRFRLGRVDTFCSFRMGSLDAVHQGVEEIWIQQRSSGNKWAVYGINDVVETCYKDQNSTRAANKFYAKGPELSVNKIPGCAVERELVIKYAQKLIRYEYTLRQSDLKRLGLDYADLWCPDKAKVMLMQKISDLNLQGEINQQLTVDKLEGLSKGQMAFYDMYAQGANLRRSRTYTPVKNARESIKKLGVDIFRPLGAGSKIALNSLFTRENAYFKGPKELTRKGAMWRPSVE